MAIKVNKPQKAHNYSRLIITLVIFAGVVAAIYFLFFAPTPAFEYIASSDIERNAALANFDLDPNVVFSSPEFDSLEVYKVDSGSGSFGRTNPFSAP